MSHLIKFCCFANSNSILSFAIFVNNNVFSFASSLDSSFSPPALFVSLGLYYYYHAKQEIKHCCSKHQKQLFSKKVLLEKRKTRTNFKYLKYRIINYFLGAFIININSTIFHCINLTIVCSFNF